MTVFETLNGVNVNEHTEKKNGLTYLSWAWAWGELLKRFPDSTYTIYENRDGWNYHTDGKTCWVKTGVTVEGKEYIEMLPVMDFKNRSISADAVTSFDVNKAIQRSLTKAVARHGLGLYIYAGEDLPEGEAQEEASDALKPGEKMNLPPAGSWNPRNAIGLFCKRVGLKLADFANLRTALIAGGIVKDIPSGELSPVDFDVLCKAMEANYPEMLKVSA
jgi:hypothetical protein